MPVTVNGVELRDADIERELDHHHDAANPAKMATISAILRVLVLMIKVLLVIVAFMMVRWSFPRFRFDQLMNLSWKALLPLGLVNLITAAILVEYGRPIAEWLELSPLVAHALIGWGVFLVSLVGITVLGPLQDDNKPRTVVSN